MRFREEFYSQILEEFPDELNKELDFFWLESFFHDSFKNILNLNEMFVLFWFWCHFRVCF